MAEVCAPPIFRANMLRAFSTFRLSKLQFAVNALEPYYDANTVTIHHQKHHQTYVDKLNAAVPQTNLSLAELITTQAASNVAVRNHGGGHYNHALFWLCLGPHSSQRQPGAKLTAAINKDFGSFQKFKEAFTNAAVNQFGSGWAWLSLNPAGKLVVSSSLNQDNPMMVGVAKETAVPFFTVDVWEHAYYLKYQNRRPEWVANFWDVVNWKNVDQFYETYALKSKPVPVDSLS